MIQKIKALPHGTFSNASSFTTRDEVRFGRRVCCDAYRILEDFLGKEAEEENPSFRL